MRGPGTNAEQITKLQEKVGDSGVRDARSIMDGYHPNVVTLAYKLMRAQMTRNRLPKAVTKLIDNLPDADAEIVRSKLTGK